MLDNIRNALSPAAVTALCWGVLVGIIVVAAIDAAWIGG